MDTIRVLLADDHTLLRAGIRVLLDSLEGITVIGEAADGRQALQMVESLRPDILMTDISMPELDGLQVAALVARDHPQSRVIILSMHAEKEYAAKALRSGAAGYLIKDSGTSELELAIRAVACGGSYLSPAVTKHITTDYVRLAAAEEEASDPLSPRQREVLRLIAEGLTTKAIAGRLDISTKTVETHRSMLMGRLNIHDVAGLVRYALRIGLVGPDV